MSDARVYKIVEHDAWQQALAQGRYTGSTDDRRDGFIHLSLLEQLSGTLARHFAGKADLLLLEFTVARLGAALRFEASRDGALFPHLYGTLDPAHVTRTWQLSPVSGTHALPDDLR